MAESQGSAAVHEVKTANRETNTFDGQKVDLFINTGKLGRHFLVKVNDAQGHPTLIAIHL